MFFYWFLEWLLLLWHKTFDNTFTSWGCVNSSPISSIDWCSVYSWMVFFVVFSIVFVLLLSKSKVVERLSKHILLLSTLIWIGGVFVYIVGFYSDGVNGLSVVPRAIISSFKMFVASNDLARVSKNLQGDASYMVAFSLMHFAAAFIALLFIFRMVGYKIKSSVKILWHKWWHANGKNVHLFWGVNEASCLMAEDISRNHGTETIIFIDIDKDSDNSAKKNTLSSITNAITIKSSEIARLDNINALIDHCYNGPAALNGKGDVDLFGVLNLRTVGSILRKAKKVRCYFLSDDETQNIAGALNVQRDTFLSLKGDNVTIYIHARKDANNEVLDHYSQYDEASSRMKIKVVDSAYLSIVSLKQNERALPVNCVTNIAGVVNMPFTALVVGFGATGQEAFKFLYEFSTFVDKHGNKIPFKCYAIDEKMDKIEGLVRAKMPAIGEDELSLIKASVDSEQFWEKVASVINQLNYVVIALNNDTLGLTLAVNLFKYALRNRDKNLPMLKIMVRCYDNNNKQRMQEVKDRLNKSVAGCNIEILLFGEENAIYRSSIIISDKMLGKAKEFHWIYMNALVSENEQKTAEEWWKANFDNDQIPSIMQKQKISRYHAIYDINRQIEQNISNAQHCDTKMILMGFDEKSMSERLNLYYGYVDSRKPKTTTYDCNKEDAQLLINIAMVEHERWIAAHKLMGFTYGPKKDMVKKQHPDMVPWDKLSEETRSYDCNVIDTTIRLAYKDAAKKKN